MNYYWMGNRKIESPVMGGCLRKDLSSNKNVVHCLSNTIATNVMLRRSVLVFNC